jgi:hypothetical protein
MTTIHTLLVVASIRESPISQLDVKNDFLNGELCEDIYMRPPPGYSVPEGMVCHLCHSLYGIKQTPQAWFQRFASVVTAGGFSTSIHDSALFVSPRGRTLLLLYVDDMIITGSFHALALYSFRHIVMLPGLVIPLTIVLFLPIVFFLVVPSLLRRLRSR